MIKLLSIVLFLFIVTNISAQNTSVDTKKSSTSDHLFKDDDDIVKALDSITSSHHTAVKVSIGIGNKLFSVKNNSLNATQYDVNQIYYTPSVSYMHKSGLSVGVTPYLTSSNGSLKVYQTALSSGYDFTNDFINTGISYTHYFADNKSYSNNSIFQHDIYGSIQYTKSFINPILSFGYSAGKYKEINSYTISTPNNRIILDSTQNKINNFSFSAGVEHNFNIDNIFSKKDGISFTPQVLLIMGSDKYTTTHLNQLDPLLLKKNKRIRAHNQAGVTSTSTTQTTKNAFSVQSLALSLDATYNFGKFFISPNIFYNYYLPKTTDKRLSTVFSVNVGFIF